MSEIVFEEPPYRAPRSGGRDHAAITAALKARPKEWARVETCRSSAAARMMAVHIQKGRVKAYRPAGTYEAASRAVDGEFRVYARYVGESSDE